MHTHTLPTMFLALSTPLLIPAILSAIWALQGSPATFLGHVPTEQSFKGFIPAHIPYPQTVYQTVDLPNPNSMTMIVKNTFVELVEEHESNCRTYRRSSSLPASLRLARNSFLEGLADKDSQSTTCASTIDSHDEVCSMCTLDSGIGSEASVVNPWDSVSSCSKNSSPEQIVLPYAQPRLSVRVLHASNPWDAFQAVAVAALMAMQVTGFVAQCSLNQTAFGFQAVAKLSSQQLRIQKDFILSAGKSAVIKTAEKSASTYVLGYEQSPFLSTPLGFSCMLCHVEDQDMACWDFLQHGRCKFEGCCRWQHPQIRATLNVMVAPSDA
jgi:hypothetical protein